MSRPTQVLTRASALFAYRAVTFSGGTSQSASARSLLMRFLVSPTTPTLPRDNFGLGSSAFDRLYSRNHYLFSSPMGTKMFQFPTFAPRLNSAVTGPTPRRVVPFGYLRISSYLPIPAAFRSLSRPSSPLRALGIHRMPFFRFISRYSVSGALSLQGGGFSKEIALPLSASPLRSPSSL